MRLAIVSDYAYPNGGVEQVVRALLVHAPAGVKTALITWQRSALTPPGFNSVITPDNGDVRTVWRALECADVVMVHSSFNVRLLARLGTEFLSRSGTPGIAVIHTSAHSHPSATSTVVQDQWLRDLTGACRRTVAVSSSVAAALASLGADEQPMVILENASRFRRERRPRQSRETVSFIGRPFASKGFDVFQKLALKVKEQRPRMTFHANTVSVPVQIKTLIQVSALLDDEDYLEFLDHTDLLVAPYQGADGLPLAILEALSCGVPVIGLDSAGLGDLLRRHDQVVVPDPDMLAAAVLDWADGTLDVPLPRSDLVPTWDQVAARYYELAAEITDDARG